MSEDMDRLVWPPDNHAPLSAEEGAEIDACLDYIYEHPEPDGDRVFSFQQPPAVFFVYDDGNHRITYTYWRKKPSREVVVRVYAITRCP